MKIKTFSSPKILKNDIKSFKFLMIGNFKRVKGIDIALDAFKRISVNHPSASLKIIGDDVENIFGEVINQRNLLDLNKQVTIVNEFLSEEDFNDEILSSNCILLPYKRIYQSHVLLQALSRSIPVIVSNLEAFLDVLGDRGNYFESGNAESLAHEMEKVILRYDDELIKSNDILREFMDSPSEFDINLFLSKLIT